MSAVANYLPRNTWIHRLNPLTKMLWSIILMTLSFLYRDPIILAVLFLSIALVAYMAGILKEMLPAFKGLLIFAGIFLLFQIFFITEGKVLFYVIPGTKILPITDEGIFGSLAMGARLMVIAASFPVLLGTTQVKDLVIMLVEKIKIPYTYAFMFITSLRFVPTFMQEMEQIVQAQCSRGHRLENRNLIRKFFSLCPLAIPLMITSVKKAEQLAISMETRGFGLGSRTYLHQIQFRAIDWGISLGMLGMVALSVYLNLQGIFQ